MNIKLLFPLKGIRKDLKMNNALLRVFAIALLIAGWILAKPCAADEKVTVTDMVGREVTLAKDPERIICISPGTLRLILYVGGKRQVVGVEDIENANPKTRPYWIANSELSRLPSIGPGGPNTINKEPDLEKVLAVNPDVVFISYMDKMKADALQTKIGIPIIVLTYGPFGTFNEIVYDSIRLVGRILDKQDRAQAVIDFIEGSRKDLNSRVEGFPEDRKPAVYVGGIGFKGTHGIESTETIYAPFEWVKAKNIAMSEGKKGHLFVDKEKILAWNPAIIFIDSGGNELVRQDYVKNPDFYHGLKAFRNREVHILHSFNWYMTNIGTVITDAYAAGEILYPKRFDDVNLEMKADQVYKFLLGKSVYQQMAEAFGSLGEVPKYVQ
jgi:iron complex transport system substrate-binding protein